MAIRPRRLNQSTLVYNSVADFDLDFDLVGVASAANGFQMAKVPVGLLQSIILGGLDLVAYTVSAAVTSSTDGARIYSNTGASGPVTLTLDAAVVGKGAAFFRDADYPLFVQLTGGSTANYGTADGLIEILSTGIISLECLTTTGQWVVLSYGAIWNGT